MTVKSTKQTDVQYRIKANRRKHTEAFRNAEKCGWQKVCPHRAKQHKERAAAAHSPSDRQTRRSSPPAITGDRGTTDSGTVAGIPIQYRTYCQGSTLFFVRIEQKRSKMCESCIYLLKAWTNCAILYPLYTHFRQDSANSVPDCLIEKTEIPKRRTRHALSARRFFM